MKYLIILLMLTGSLYAQNKDVDMTQFDYLNNLTDKREITLEVIQDCDFDIRNNEVYYQKRKLPVIFLTEKGNILLYENKTDKLLIITHEITKENEEVLDYIKRLVARMPRS